MAYIPYGRQNITPEDIAAVVKSLRSDFLTQGPEIKNFEVKFAEYVGAKYAVAVSNGTTALHLAAKALGTKAKQRIITTPLSFAATANCIRYCDAEVEFVDIHPETLNLDANKVEALLRSNPPGTFSGIIPVAFAGYPTDLEAFRKLADEFNLWIIEDACHAPGAAFKDSKGTWQQCGNGNFADLTVFSFHPVKHIACGEGGMVTTNDELLYEKLMLLRTHGITKDPTKIEESHGGWYYEMQTLGYNYRLSDIACALGTSQLSRASEGLDRRIELADRYDEAFGANEVKTITVPQNIKHAFHLYTIQVENRKEMYDYLKKNGIGAQVHYIPIHLMPYYQELGWKKGDFPIVEQYYDQCLSIPMFPSLTNSEQDLVIELIRNFNHEKISNNTSKRWKQKVAA